MTTENHPIGSKTSDYDDALRQMGSPNADIEKVRALLVAASSAGDHRATYALAKRGTLHGSHLEKDTAKAIELLTAASHEGNADAMFDLAICYETGDEVAVSKILAFNLFVSAAFFGDRLAIYEVGRMLFYGIGTTADKQLARLWLDRAERPLPTE